MPYGKEIKAEDFEAAALPHLKDLYRTAARLTANRTEAEDLVQETYMQAWKSFHKFQIGTNCRAWLFKILLNKIRHQRSKWLTLVWRTRELSDVVVYEHPISENLSDEAVLVALKKIPDCYREVVVLTDVQEFSYKEAAFILKIPVGTVMSRLSRGRKLLRTELGDVAADYGIGIAKVRT